MVFGRFFCFREKIVKMMKCEGCKVQGERYELVEKSLDKGNPSFIACENPFQVVGLFLVTNQ